MPRKARIDAPGALHHIMVRGIERRRNKNRSVINNLEQLRTWDWQGWVEIANTDYLPLFQGKIVAAAADRDHAGTLLSGVLLAGFAPSWTRVCCLVLNSIDTQHMDSPEGMAQFEEIWQASLPKQATGLNRGNIRDS